jgi:hypothetical protein
MENLVDQEDVTDSSDDLQDVYSPEVEKSELLLNNVFTEFMKKEKLSRLDAQLLQGVFTDNRDKLKIPSIFKQDANLMERDKPGFESIFRKKRNR